MYNNTFFSFLLLFDIMKSDLLCRVYNATNNFCMKNTYTFADIIRNKNINKKSLFDSFY